MVLGMSGLAEPPTTITTEAPPNFLLSRFASVFSFFSILCCSCINKISNNTYLDNLLAAQVALQSNFDSFNPSSGASDCVPRVPDEPDAAIEGRRACVLLEDP